jgi:hypothetical protein
MKSIMSNSTIHNPAMPITIHPTGSLVYFIPHNIAFRRKRKGCGWRG